MEASWVRTALLLCIAFGLPGCREHGRSPQEDTNKIVVTPVASYAVKYTQQHRCTIYPKHGVEVLSPVFGYLTMIFVREGQAVKQGDPLFRVEPHLGNNKTFGNNGNRVVFIYAKADGLVGRLPIPHGSLVQDGTKLTSIGDFSELRCYFRVLTELTDDLSDNLQEGEQSPDVELILESGRKFSCTGNFRGINTLIHGGEGNYISFRADFPNPNNVLLDGEAGSLSITLKCSKNVYIPPHASVENHGKRYVYVVDQKHVAQRREVVAQIGKDGRLLIEKGLKLHELIVSKGVEMVRNGARVE